MENDRDRLTEQLRAYGDRRRAARAAEREQLDAIAILLSQALSLGISKREITRLTGVSRPWVEALIKRDASDTR